MKKVLIKGSDRVLYVNENEDKGKSLIKRNGITQPRVVNFWKNAVEKVDPTIVFDIGLCYGEILFSTKYDNNTRLVGIEANVHLSPFILKAIKEHPNQKQINVIYALASDCNSKKDFYIDKNRSGNSSVYFLENRPQSLINVDSITVDSMFLDQASLSKETVLFKIDVEGHEWNVLEGMIQTIKGCNEFAGVIEFNFSFLERVGIDIHKYLNFLKEYFLVFPIGTDNNLVNINHLNIDNLKSYLKSDPKCKDLILLSNNELIDKLGLEIVQVDL